MIRLTRAAISGVIPEDYEAPPADGLEPERRSALRIVDIRKEQA